jgi:copper(I)-binding protein
VRSRPRPTARCTLLALAALAVCACDQARPAAGVQVEDAYLPAPPGDVAAVYFRVRDRSGAGDTLVGVQSPRAAAMLHQTVIEGGTAQMRPAEDGLPVPPGGVLELRPGGAHVMLMGISEPLAVGETVPLELHFERAGTVTVQAPVVSLADALEER